MAQFFMRGMKEMQIQLNAKNISIALIVFAFVYLSYLLWGDEQKLPEMIEVDLRDLLSYAVLAVEMGGHAIRQLHEERLMDKAVKGQTDEGKDEYLTKADLVSNHLIMEVLQRYPALHVISEERQSDFLPTEREADKYRSDNYKLWLGFRDIVAKLPNPKRKLSKITVWVDPLDATQEYTEGLLEYVTVMVCVVYDGEPIIGVIHRPFNNDTVIGMVGWGSIDSSSMQKWTEDMVENASRTIVVSRSHAGSVRSLARKAFKGEYKVEPAGGAGYKTLRILNGTAQLYVHTTAIKKWDICAGDALMRSIGGTMFDLEGSPISYSRHDPVVNKKGLLVAYDRPFTFLQRLRPVLI